MATDVKAVRLHHPTLRNCVFTVEQVSRPYPVPFECPLCSSSRGVVTHIYKTFHLNLNQHGNVCVTPEIYDVFKSEGLLVDVLAMKEVRPAPTVLHVGAGPLVGGEPIVVSQEMGLVRHPGRNGHGRS